MSKVITQLLWFFIATLCDWLKHLAPLSQPIRSKTKTNIVTSLHTRFPALGASYDVFDSRSDWLIGLSASVVFGESDYFGFGCENCFNPKKDKV